MKLTLWVPSSMNGSFDGEATAAFGMFCQAAMEGDQEAMRKITSGLRALSKYELMVFGVGLIGGTVAFSMATFSGAPAWLVVLVGMPFIVVSFALQRTKRREILNTFPLPNPPARRFWLVGKG